ncbi:MAG: TonB-dependent receptor, partial [Gemmatimonadaceae bacterium]
MPNLVGWGAGCGALAMLSIPLAAQQRDTTAKDSAATLRRLAPITIVATPASRQSPAGSLHLDAAALRVVPATSTFDLLRQTSGVEVHEQGQGPGFTSNASLRGFSSDHSTDLALWIDGVPINEPVNGHAEGYNDFAVLYPAAVSDVDVIRGPTSALFGNFALAGVVNVRTLERLRGTDVQLSTGSNGRGEVNLMTGFDHGSRGGGIVGVRYEHEDGFRPNSRFDVGQGHARVVHDINQSVRVDGGVELYSTRWHSPGFLGEEDFANGNYDVVSNPSDGGFKRRAQERLSVRVLHRDLLWRTTAYATQGRWQLYLTIPPAGGRFEGSGSQTEEEDRRHGYGITSALTWERASRSITVGLDGRWDHAAFENWYTTSRSRDSVAEVVSATQRSGALFAIGHIDVTTRWQAEMGVRLDDLSTRAEPDAEAATSHAHAIASPKLGSMVRLTPTLSAYANVSGGFRSTDGVISDPTLAPITAWAYEAGIKVDRHQSQLTVAAFRMGV